MKLIVERGNPGLPRKRIEERIWTYLTYLTYLAKFRTTGYAPALSFWGDRRQSAPVL